MGCHALPEPFADWRYKGYLEYLPSWLFLLLTRLYIYVYSLCCLFSDVQPNPRAKGKGNPNISPVPPANSLCLIIGFIMCAACGELADSSLQSDARSFLSWFKQQHLKSRKSDLIKLNTKGSSKLFYF